MIDNIKVLKKINEYKFMIVYICEPLINKTSEGSLTEVLLSEARLVGM